MTLSGNLIKGPVLILVIGLLLAAGWWSYAVDRNETIQRQEFDARVDELAQKLLDRLNVYERGLRGARGAIAAAGGEAVTHKNFLAYIRSRDMEREYPGARGIGFIRLLKPDNKQALVARMHREGLSDFAIHGMSPRNGEHFVIQFIEPLERNRQAMGLDIASEERRRAAALRAMESGEATLTAPITLVQATGSPQRGFLFLLPVYREHEAGSGARGNAYGWTYSPLVIDEVLADLDLKSYTFSLSDTTDQESSAVFYRSPVNEHEPVSSLNKRIGMKLYGRDWALDATASGDFIQRLNLSSPAKEAGVFLLLFALFSVALLLYLREIQRRLQESISAQIGDAAPEAMLVVDESGVITYANKRLAVMFGYSIEALLGNKMEMLLPAQLRQRHAADRAGYDRVPRIMGQGRYLIAQRKNGEEFPVEVSLAPLQAGVDRLTVGMVVDVTMRREMEEALRANEKRWRFALEGSGDGVWDWDLQTGAISLSAVGAEMFGFAENEIEKNISAWYARLSTEDQLRWKEALQQLFKSGADRFSLEYRVRCKDGEYKWVLTRGMVVSRFPDGKVARMIGVHTDVNSRKLAEAALAKSEERFRETLNQAPALIWITDKLNKGTWYNQRWLEYTGRTMEQELGFGWIKGMHPDDRDRCTGICQDAFDKRQRFMMELRLRRADGSYGWIADSGIPRFDEQGNFEGYIGYCWDISARKSAENALQESERKYRSLAGNIPGMLYRGGSDWRVEYISHSELLCGYSHDELQSSTSGWLQIIHPDDRARVLEESARLVKEPCALVQEYRIAHKNGEVRWVSDHKQSIFDDDVFAGVDGIVFDITDRKRAEQEVALSKERLRRSQMFANIGTWDWNIQTGELYWTERIAPLFGYPLGDLETSYENFLGAVHPDDRQKLIDAVNASVEKDLPYEIEHRVVWPDGTMRWLLERGAVVRDPEGKPLHMLGVVQDIHERRVAQEALRDSEARWSFAVEGAGDGIWDWNILTGEMPLSGHYEDMLGYRKGEMEPTIEGWIASVHPDDLPRAQANLKEYLEGRFPAYVIELRLRCKDGSYKWILCRGTVVERDAEGKPTRMIGIHTDINQRKTMEAELVEASYAAESANRAKSEFLSSMSHELRTPLNAVLGFGQLLEADGKLDAEQQDSVNEIIKAGRHLLELVNEVLDLAKIEAGRIELSLEPVALAELVTECVSLVKPLADKRGISIKCEKCGEEHVRADRVRLKQVLLNLLSNAVKYNREGGSIALECYPGGADCLRLAVSDTGMGIPAERMEELFMPFRRLEAENSAIEGTGIGLTITRRLVEMMGGSIGVKSTPGKGSTFWIELPETWGGDAHAHHAETEDAAGHAPASGSHSVLYIEDNPVNLKLVSQILARRPDIRLLAAHEPALGIELAQAHRPDLVLLDINLPGMDGYKVLQLLRADATLCAVPVIAVTANALPRDVERGLQAGFAAYLTKPLEMATFLKALDDALQTN